MKTDLFSRCCKGSMMYHFVKGCEIPHKQILFCWRGCSNHVPNYLNEHLISHSCLQPMSHLSSLLTRKLSHFCFVSSICSHHANNQQIAFKSMAVVIVTSTKSSIQNFHLSIRNLCILNQNCLLLVEG
jgi:hypothetical protein